jgi:hypothetical protein
VSVAGRSSTTRVRVLGAAAGAVLMGSLIAGYQGTRSPDAPPAPPRAAAAAPLLSNAAFERRSGVRIVRVAVSGGGGLLDLRYQVIDPDAAAAIHGAPPQLVDESTRVVAGELLMGHSHKGRLRAAQTYYLVFENPGGLVRRGSSVTVQLGAARVAHVPVR